MASQFGSLFSRNPKSALGSTADAAGSILSPAAGPAAGPTSPTKRKTVADLGRTVKELYPDQFSNDDDDVIVGRATKAAYPDQFSDVDDLTFSKQQAAAEIARVAPGTLPGILGQRNQPTDSPFRRRMLQDPAFSPRVLATDPVVNAPRITLPTPARTQEEVEKNPWAAIAADEAAGAAGLADWEIEALKQTGRGVKNVARGTWRGDADAAAGGAAEAIQGVGRAALPVALPFLATAAAAPGAALPVVGGLVGGGIAGELGSRVGEWGAEKLGAGPGVQALAKELGMLVGGAKGAALGARAGGTVQQLWREPALRKAAEAEASQRIKAAEAEASQRINLANWSDESFKAGQDQRRLQQSLKDWMDETEQLAAQRAQGLRTAQQQVLSRPVDPRLAQPKTIYPLRPLAAEESPLIPPSRQLEAAPIRLGPVEGIGHRPQTQIALPPRGTNPMADRISHEAFPPTDAEPPILYSPVAWAGTAERGPVVDPSITERLRLDPSRGARPQLPMEDVVERTRNVQQVGVLENAGQLPTGPYRPAPGTVAPPNQSLDADLAMLGFRRQPAELPVAQQGLVAFGGAPEEVIGKLRSAALGLRKEAWSLRDQVAALKGKGGRPLMNQMQQLELRATALEDEMLARTPLMMQDDLLRGQIARLQGELNLAKGNKLAGTQAAISRQIRKATQQLRAVEAEQAKLKITPPAGGAAAAPAAATAAPAAAAPAAATSTAPTPPTSLSAQLPAGRPLGPRDFTIDLAPSRLLSGEAPIPSDITGPASNRGIWQDLKDLGHSWKNKARDAIVSNLSTTGEVAPGGWKAARSLSGTRAQAAVAANRFAVGAEDLRSLPGAEWTKTGPVADVPASQIVFDVLTESRLRGMETKYRQLSDMIGQADDKQIFTAWREWLGDALRGLDKIQGSKLAQDVADDIIGANYDRIRGRLSGFFKGLADSGRVASVDLPAKYGADFEKLVNDPFVQQGIKLYKASLEPEFQRMHGVGEGFFSDSLGPLNTYFPLIRAKDSAAMSAANLAGANRGVGFLNTDRDILQANPTNYFSTGLGQVDSYRAGLESVKAKLSQSYAANGRIGLVKELEKAGVIIPDDPAGGSATLKFQGLEVPKDPRYVTKVQVKAGSLVTPFGGSKKVKLPAESYYVPNSIAGEIGWVFSAGDPTPSEMAGLARTLIDVALIGPADAVFHTSNVIGALTATTSNLGGGALSRIAQSSTMVKKLMAIGKLIQQARTESPFEGQMAQDLQRMAELGYLPNRYASTTSNPKLAKILDIPLEGNPIASKGLAKARIFDPFLFGPNGLDMQARLLAYRLAKTATGGRDNSPEFARAMDALINYNRLAQPAIQRAIKSSPIASMMAPFVSAGTAKLATGARMVAAPWRGDVGPLGQESSPMQKAAWFAENQLNAGVTGAVMSWAAWHHQLTGKWPWDDPDARLGEFKVPDEIRKTTAFKLAYGDNPDSAFFNMRFQNPVLMAGLRGTGIKGAVDTRIKGGNWTQAFENGLMDAANANAHPFISGPAPAIIGGFFSGTHPYLAQLRDPHTGKFSPAAGSDLPTRSGLMDNLAARGMAAAGAINPIGEAAMGFLSEELLGGETTSPVDRGDKLVQMGLDYLLAGMRSPTRSTPTIQKNLLLQQRQIAGREAREKAVGAALKGDK